MLWLKTFHILFVTSWFAGLFYLPRIYVNLAREQDTKTYETLLGMARRLYRFMAPLAILTLLTGLGLFLYYGIGKGQGWMHAKLTLVLILFAFHGVCGRYLRQFQQGQQSRSHVFFRWFNEIPVIVLLLVLILVVIKPF
ncbi:CopD family protein [Alcaligenes faecalis]|uniref:CopD family protein n=1 Tax=Alcaligenes faecalis TaxID=511 RepID=UPI002932B5B3|nr:CopD family protein [Alcaligenes faecalis]MDV2114673.1 CopD family protein [Alcaligenes faecalis]